MIAIKASILIALAVILTCLAALIPWWWYRYSADRSRFAKRDSFWLFVPVRADRASASWEIYGAKGLGFRMMSGLASRQTAKKLVQRGFSQHTPESVSDAIPEWAHFSNIDDLVKSGNTMTSEWYTGFPFIMGGERTTIFVTPASAWMIDPIIINPDSPKPRYIGTKPTPGSSQEFAISAWGIAGNMCFYFISIVGVWYATRAGIARLRLRRSLCPSCRYPVANLPICPECGTRLPLPPPLPIPQVPPPDSKAN